MDCRGIHVKFHPLDFTKTLNKRQVGLEDICASHKRNIAHLEIQRMEIKTAHHVQALKGGEYLVGASGVFHGFNKNSPVKIIELVGWQGNVGPVFVGGLHRFLMKTKAWFWYMFSDHFVIDYFPIIIAFLALAKFGWLSYCRP